MKSYRCPKCRGVVMEERPAGEQDWVCINCGWRPAIKTELVYQKPRDTSTDKPYAPRRKREGTRAR